MSSVLRAGSLLGAGLAVGLIGAASLVGAGGVQAAGMKATKMAKPTPKAMKVVMKGPAMKGPGQCGTYMYWKAGKCLDARAKVPKK